MMLYVFLTRSACVFFSPQVTQKLYFQLPLVPMGGSWPVGLEIPLFDYGTLIPRHQCLHAQVENLCLITLLACLFLIVEVSVADYCEKNQVWHHMHMFLSGFFLIWVAEWFFLWSFWWYVRSQFDYPNKTETSLSMSMLVVALCT